MPTGGGTTTLTDVAVAFPSTSQQRVLKMLIKHQATYHRPLGG